MTGPQTQLELTPATLEEHRQIHFYLDQVRASLKALSEAAAADDVEPMRRLAAQLQSLAERLSEHHEHEVRGGLHAAIVENLPEALDDLRTLAEQHHKIIEVLEMGRIHAQFGQTAEAEDLRADLERYLEMIRNHELAEQAILERAIESERPPID